MTLGTRHAVRLSGKLAVERRTARRRWQAARGGVVSYMVKAVLPCKRCGIPTERRERVSRDPQCLDCACAKMERNIGELREKRGPMYDKWRKALREAFTED